MPLLRLVVSLLLFVCVVRDAAARVIFVDNSRTAGNGTYDLPFATLAEAQRASVMSDIIYVAEGSGPYEESITLKSGQMLIGAAYGLDAARVEFHATFIEPSQPASQGPGPLIHGGVYAAGENVIAGFTIAPEVGVGIAAFSPQGKIDIRKVFVRPGARATGISLQSSDVSISIDGGGVTGEGGNGLFFDGGRGDIVVDHFPIRGTFTTALAIRNRIAGKVTFGSAAALKIDDATRDAITIMDVKGPIAFESPLQLVTHGGRGLVIARSAHVKIAGNSHIDSTNAAALELHEAALDATFERISATGVAPGVLREGIIIDKSRGKLVIAGDEQHTPASAGTIRNAQVYGIRVVQSSGFHLSDFDIFDSGSGSGKCPDDIVAATNVRCAAGVYLRHVTDSTFANVRITGGAVGVNANNVRDLTFDRLDIRGTGVTKTDPAMLMQESGGTVTMTRCNVTDGMGGQLAIEQRFTPVAFIISDCTIAAPQRPTASTALLSVRAAGAGAVDIHIASTNFRENAGSAIDAEARETSSVSIAIDKSSAQNLGASFVEMIARQSASARLSLHGTRVVAPGSSRPLVAVTIIDAARGCADIAGNDLVGGASVQPVVLTGAATQCQ
jgi:hypothetical protein